MDDRTPGQKKANYVGGRPKDTRKLSTDPRQIRNRLRRNANRLEGVMSTDIELLYGKPVEEWDLEELARGRPRNKDGKFSGPRPKWISPHVQLEARRRLVDEAHGLLASHLNTAIKVMANLLVSQEVDFNGKPIVDSKTKFAAASFIIEHLIGKPQAMAELKIQVDEPKQALAAAIVLDDGNPQDFILEGQIVDEDDLDEEEDDEDGA